MSVEILNGNISHSFISNDSHGNTNNSCATHHVQMGEYLQLKLDSSFFFNTMVPTVDRANIRSEKFQTVSQFPLLFFAVNGWFFMLMFPLF